MLSLVQTSSTARRMSKPSNTWGIFPAQSRCKKKHVHGLKHCRPVFRNRKRFLVLHQESNRAFDQGLEDCVALLISGEAVVTLYFFPRLQCSELCQISSNPNNNDSRRYPCADSGKRKMKCQKTKTLKVNSSACKGILPGGDGCQMSCCQFLVSSSAEPGRGNCCPEPGRGNCCQALMNLEVKFVGKGG